MSTAIDLYRPAGLPAIIDLLGADVACTLRIAERTRRRGEPRDCDVMLANKSQVPVTGRLYGVDHRKHTRDFGQITVMPNGLGSSSFVLPAIADECERVYLEVSGDGIKLSAHAPINAPVRNSSRAMLATGAIILAFGSVMAATAFLVERPTITALRVPTTAVPGLVRATYSTAGYGSGSYIVAATDGTLLGAGTFAGGNGDVPIVVPEKIAGQSVRISLDVRGPFGQAHREAQFPTMPPARTMLAPVLYPALPRIGYFSAHRERYAGKTSVLASYLASGTSGTLRVLDEQGRFLGSSSFSHVGTSRVVLATDPGRQPLRAEIEVTRAGSRTTSAIEIPADTGNDANAGIANDAAAASAGTVSAGEDAGSASTPSDPFFVDERVVGGREFQIMIRHPLPNLRIGLQTTTGTTIDEVSVPPGARAVTLRAPASSMLEIYYLAGTFTQSSAEEEETVIRSLRIYPD